MNKAFFYLSIHTALLAVLFTVPTATFADETFNVGTVMTTATFRFNNENWFTVEHPKIATFTIQDDGSSYGMTETGISFIQYNVPNQIGARIQRFEIQDHYHYIVDGTITYSLGDFSVQLAQAYSKSLST
ncbi:MAG: hypothetical protein K9M10_02010 [Candidatus Pacebacteria bacterium]|nr:hypothetical protein [Candidatus Paceibacterota bacterium]MCF7857239.1 hypothetical protein [Candidatus Paceibacterota bacterium]